MNRLFLRRLLLRASSVRSPAVRAFPTPLHTPKRPDHTRRRLRDQIRTFSAARASSGVGEGKREKPKTNTRCTLLDIPGDVAEELADLLLGCGALSAAVEEHRPEGEPEQKIYDEDLLNGRVWDRCRVVALYPAEVDLYECCIGPAEYLLGQAPDSESEDVAATEWEDQIRAAYRPEEVVEGVWVVPDWALGDAGPHADPSAVQLILEPGLCFGSGEHPTTRLCVRALKQVVKAGDRVMDYGTGSGVLAIAALRFGADSVSCTDVDPLSVTVSERNAALNGMEGRVRSYQCGPVLDDPEPLTAAGLPLSNTRGAFEVVAANILRGPILDLCDRLSWYCKPGGKVVLSGILATQAPDVEARYSRFFTGLEVRTEGDWACLVGTRNDAQAPEPVVKAPEAEA